MIAETPRLIIRKPQLDDAVIINKAINRSLHALQKWEPWSKDPRLSVTQDFIKKAIHSWNTPSQNDFPMIVEEKNTNTIICVTGFNDKSDPLVPYYEIGYWIDSKYSGNGYVTEAVNAITRLAFDKFSAVRVQIASQEENYKSIAVAKRCGFEKEATLKRSRKDCISGEPKNTIILACFDKLNLPELNVRYYL